MTLQEQKEQLRKESGAAYRCPTFEFMWGKLQEKQAEIAELEKKYQNVSSWNVDALKQINEHKAEIQKLHDLYQKQIGEWEEGLKAAEDWINKKCLKKDIERYYLNIKHQTPAPKE